MFGDNLERLLKNLFDDDNGSTSDVEVLNWHICPPMVFGNCCTYNYAGYDG